jgi:peptidoglycan/xylan/chitin deacetylase (PgdA/CDA1 family)
MRLLVLMYHRARPGRDGNSPEMLEAHFRHIAARCRNVLPGEAVAGPQVNVCLSFDDGYFDFHSVVFPLLKKYGLRALLAVPPGAVRERTEASDADRLAVPTELAFVRPRMGGLCTWPELQAMAASGHVAIAAHGYTHVPIDPPRTDLDMELRLPKMVLESRLAAPVDSFVFPYGKFSGRAFGEARSAYRHVFRIGGAANLGWDGGLLYRVGADAMRGPERLFSRGRMAAYRARFLWNRMRGR